MSLTTHPNPWRLRDPRPACHVGRMLSSEVRPARERARACTNVFEPGHVNTWSPCDNRGTWPEAECQAEPPLLGPGTYVRGPGRFRTALGRVHVLGGSWRVGGDGRVVYTDPGLVGVP